MNAPHHISHFLNCSLLELHQMLVDGEVTSFQLIETHFKEIERVNPQLNAIVSRDKEYALEQAKKADLAIQNGERLSLLHGIPITIKDNFEVKNSTTTAGFAPFKDFISTIDARIVQQLKNAGAIIIGKTNLPSLTYDLQTNNQLFGRTNNPWNQEHTTGGSSGGCAAAISSGMSRISFCNDSGGSIRIPAHFCGVHGFKSSLKGISTEGIITRIQKEAVPLKMRTLLSVGMFGQSIGDLQVAMKVIGSTKLISGPDNNVPVDKIKLLWIDQLRGLEVDTEIKEALAHLRKELIKSGVTIVDFLPEQFDFMKAIRMWGHLSNYETGKEMPSIARYAGHVIMRRKYSKIPMYIDLLKPISSRKYKKLRVQHEALKEQFESMLTSYDGLVLPASSVLAFPHQKPDRKIGHLGIYTTPLRVNQKKVQYAIATQSYSLPFNVLESPVVSLPIALSKNKLPIGVQLVGKKNMDFDLLEVASTLDRIIPTIGRPKI